MVRQLEFFMGKVVEEIKGEEGSDRLTFYFNDGNRADLYHDQCCCEDVRIESIDGELDDLLNSPILQAELVSNTSINREPHYNQGSYTWTFYKFATINGYVTIRWFGTSNGWYSEEVSFSINGKDSYIC